MKVLLEKVLTYRADMEFRIRRMGEFPHFAELTEKQKKLFAVCGEVQGRDIWFQYPVRASSLKDISTAYVLTYPEEIGNIPPKDESGYWWDFMSNHTTFKPYNELGKDDLVVCVKEEDVTCIFMGLLSRSMATRIANLLGVMRSHTMKSISLGLLSMDGYAMDYIDDVYEEKLSGIYGVLAGSSAATVRLRRMVEDYVPPSATEIGAAETVPDATPTPPPVGFIDPVMIDTSILREWIDQTRFNTASPVNQEEVP